MDRPRAHKRGTDTKNLTNIFILNQSRDRAYKIVLQPAQLRRSPGSRKPNQLELFWPSGFDPWCAQSNVLGFGHGPLTQGIG